MDLQRSCYRSHMRLYSDRPDILVPGRWYRCPPGAKPVGWTAFFARRNELQDTVDAPLGEVYQSRYAYSKTPANPRLDGQHACGGPPLLEGIPYADRPGLVLDVTGMPTCCQAAPPPPARLTLCGQGSTPQVYTATVAISAKEMPPPPTVSVAIDATYIEHPPLYSAAVAIDAPYYEYPMAFSAQVAISVTYPDPGLITTACCPANPTPRDLTVSFSALDPCATLAGQSFPLTYDDAHSWWVSEPVTLAGRLSQVIFECDGGTWILAIYASPITDISLWAYAGPSLGTCSPFSWTVGINGGSGGGPCNGVVSIGTIVPT